MYTNQGGWNLKTDLNDFKNNIVPYWIEHFFKDPRYLVLKNKPVLSIYEARAFFKNLGKPALDYLKEACKKAGFDGCTVLMEHRNSTVGIMKKMRAIGVEYCYAYTWSTSDLQSQKKRIIAQNILMFTSPKACVADITAFEIVCRYDYVFFTNESQQWQV